MCVCVSICGCVCVCVCSLGTWINSLLLAVYIARRCQIIAANHFLGLYFFFYKGASLGLYFRPFTKQSSDIPRTITALYRIEGFKEVVLNTLLISRQTLGHRVYFFLLWMYTVLDTSTEEYLPSFSV